MYKNKIFIEVIYNFHLDKTSAPKLKREKYKEYIICILIINNYILDFPLLQTHPQRWPLANILIFFVRNSQNRAVIEPVKGKL